ncbi:hypothetical protein SCHPADRAFT_218881 [Schizopora paradoxa]|uniref:Uncharacterized protein n=1 Tax=Schizopora paradoxa TaxID=27342 RepID=A0A0H2RX21_9AGAM|nr:hypothetical protein SCHPADRAFT_218881 [Schizopora paradoxa]
MGYEGWLEDSADGESISRRVRGHLEALDGLEIGDYSLRIAIVIEYELPLCDLWNIESRNIWKETIAEVLEDFRTMRISPPSPKPSIYRRGDRAVLCIWELGDRGSDESAQDIFERAQRFRKLLVDRITSRELIDSAVKLRIREMLLFDWYIAPCHASLTSEYVCNTDRAERFKMQKSDRTPKPRATSSKEPSISLAQAQPSSSLPSPPAERSPQLQPVSTVPTDLVSPRRVTSTPPSSAPLQGRSDNRTVLQSSEVRSSKVTVKAKAIAPPSASDRSTALSASSAAQERARPVDRDPSSSSSAAQDRTDKSSAIRTRDPRRRPTVSKETKETEEMKETKAPSATLSRSASSKGLQAPTKLTDFQPRKPTATQELKPRSLKPDPKFSQAETTSESQNLHVQSCMTTKLPVKTPAVATQHPKIDSATSAIDHRRLGTLDSGQQTPKNGSVVLAPASTPSTTNDSFKKGTDNLPSTSSKKDLDNANSSPTIPAKRPRDDDDDVGSKKGQKTKPTESPFFPSRRSSAPTLSLTKGGLSSCIDTYGDASGASTATSADPNSSTQALLAKVRFLEKQREKDLVRLDSLFAVDNKGEAVTVVTLERKIAFLQNCNMATASSNAELSSLGRPPGSSSSTSESSAMDIDSASGRSEIGTKEYQRSHGTLEELRRQLEQAHIDKSRSDNDAKVTREAHATEVRRRCEVEKTHDDLVEQLKTSETLRKDLEEQLVQLSMTRELEKGQGDQAIHRAASLEKELRDAVLENSFTNERLEKALKRCEETEEKLAKMTKAASEGQVEFKVLRSEKLQLGSQLRGVSSELEAVKKSLVLTEEELLQTNEIRGAAEKEASDLNEELSSLRQSHTQVVKDKSAAEESLNSCRAELERTRAEFQSVSTGKDNQIADLQRKLKEKAFALHQSDSHAAQMNERLRLAHEELEKATASNRSLQERLSEAQGNIVSQGVFHSVERDNLLSAEGRAMEAEARATDAQKALKLAESVAESERFRRMAAESTIFDIFHTFKSK